jgi:hypothetical protein
LIPHTETIPYYPGSDPVPPAFNRGLPDQGQSGRPTTMHVACSGLFGHESATVTNGWASFRSNPCLANQARKRVAWTAVLGGLLLLGGLVVITDRNRSRVAADPVAPGSEAQTGPAP